MHYLHSQYHQQGQAIGTNHTRGVFTRNSSNELADVTSQSTTCDRDIAIDIDRISVEGTRLTESHSQAANQSLLDKMAKISQELGELRDTIHYMQGVQDAQNQTIQRLLSLHWPSTGAGALEEEYEDPTLFPADESCM